MEAKLKYSFKTGGIYRNITISLKDIKKGRENNG